MGKNRIKSRIIIRAQNRNLLIRSPCYSLKTFYKFLPYLRPYYGFTFVMLYCCIRMHKQPFRKYSSEKRSRTNTFKAMDTVGMQTDDYRDKSWYSINDANKRLESNG